MLGDIEYRYTERDAFCGGCDKEIVAKTEKVFATYSYRNKGQHIYICVDCINKFNQLVKESENESNEMPTL